jgi:hypothetical protein
MNTKNKAVYTMIGGLLIKNVPNWANKVKILSNGAVFALSENKQCQILDSNDSFALGNHDKYGFVVFDVPPLAPCFEVGSALGFDSFGVDGCISGVNCGGPIESGKTYVVGETPLTTEIPKVSTESLDVTEIQDKNKKSLNILNLTFYDGEKLSNIFKMVESEIITTGLNVDYDFVNNQEEVFIDEDNADSLLNALRSKLAIKCDNLNNHLLNKDCKDCLIDETMNEIFNLRKSLKILSGHKKFIIKPVID